MQKNDKRSNTFPGPSTSSEPLLINRSTSLPSPEQVKQFLNNLKNNITNITRSLTIFGSKTQGVPRSYSGTESLSTIVSINGLTIKIGSKYFTLVQKYVLFDRRYVDFNVYNSDPNNNAGVEPEYELTAYASSSQVGAWRLCKTEDGNRLNKFDDYVQSTVIHVILAKFICEKFYTQQLLWADEPPNGSRQTVNRNEIRNNMISFQYPLKPGGIPQIKVLSNMPQVGNRAAIPIYYVMEDRLYAYQTYPVEYLRRTQNDENISKKIWGRGLTEPCPFNYWIDKGTCGDYITQGEPEIKRRLDEFSRQMDQFYEIETNPIPQGQGQGKMKITELYKDCMVYKNFKQNATIFKVRLTPKVFTTSDCEPPFKKQAITIVFVQYTIKQWNDEMYEPKECNDQTPEVSEPDIEIPGYYILTIIPTKGKIKTLLSSTETDIVFNTITDIGLFVQYIKAGFYACKPLDYKRQCDMTSFIEEVEVEVGKKRSINKIPSTINYEYVSIANRLNNQFPFYKLFSFDTQMRKALKTYNENPIIIPGKTPILGRRTLTTTGDMRLLQIANLTDDLKDEVTECPTPLRRTDTNVIGKKIRQGGTNKQNKRNKQNKTNKKQYRNKLHTNKIRKCKNKKKRTTKKQRITKKRRI
jgi:hypothetical protein